MQIAILCLQSMSMLPLLVGLYSAFSLWRYAVGTHPRYAYATLCIVAYALAATMTLVVAALDMLIGDKADSALYAVFTILNGWVAYLIYRREDNWFKGRWGKMKKGFKRFIAKIPSLLPRPRLA